jgi:hypothetical protein
MRMLYYSGETEILHVTFRPISFVWDEYDRPFDDGDKYIHQPAINQ